MAINLNPAFSKGGLSFTTILVDVYHLKKECNESLAKTETLYFMVTGAGYVSDLFFYLFRSCAIYWH